MRSITHAIQVLLLFSGSRRALSVTEIAGTLRLHKSSVSRILATLAQARFVARDPETGKYALGLGILSLAGTVLAQYQLPSAARRELESLAERTGESVTVSGWNGREAVNLDQIHGDRSIINISPPGRLNPAHCTASGKIFLAYLNESERNEVLRQPLERFTAMTLTDRDSIERDIALTRARGFSFNDREFSADVVAIGAPVFNAYGGVAYAVTVAIPFFRFDAGSLDGIARELVGTTRQLSARLGGGVAEGLMNASRG